jgi:PKD repeat protein
MGCFEESNDEKPKNKYPVADAGKNQEAFTGTTIIFDGSNSTDPDGEIESYHWDFDDYHTPGLEISKAMDPTYTYDYPGEYYVTLTIEDDSGAVSTDTIIITIYNRQPIANAGQHVTVYIYDIVYFNGSGNDLDGYITDYYWDFEGDGEIDWHATSKGSTTYFFKEPGEYQASFAVTDDYGNTTSAIKNITVLDIIKLSPVADAGINQTVPIGSVLLQGTGVDPDGKIVLYEWDFDGDGEYDWSSETNGVTYYNYSSEGEYQLNFRVTDETGLIDTDSVIIRVDKTYIKYFTSAQVFIDWNASYDYLIIFNTSVNYSQIRITISDIISKENEQFNSMEFDIQNETTVTLTSSLLPNPGSALQVQVLYFDTLIGARTLDIVNQSNAVISQDIDFLALYDFEQVLTETDRGETEKIKVTSVGELELEQYGDLIYSTLHGTGEYYVYDEYDGGESEITVESEDLWINMTYSKGRIIKETLSFVGQGEMTGDYEGLDLFVDIKVMHLALENRIELENYLYGEGEFSGTTTDPSSGLEVELSGVVYITNDLLGRGKQKNYLGDEFDCSIYYSNLTLEGATGPAVGGLQSKIEMVFLNTSWMVDFEKYSNNTIYYEYWLYTSVANLEFTDSGTGYPQNSPSLRDKAIHITDAMYFSTPRPRVMTGYDLAVLSSEHDVKIKLSVDSDFETKIYGKYYQCVQLDGVIISGGSGRISLRLISEGTFAGVTVRTNQDVTWKNESLYLNQVMKKLNKI